MWDRLAADRVDVYIANSRTVRTRIQKYYKREAHIIYPPVDTGKFFISPDEKDYFLIGGRLAPYKRVDIVIEAFLGTEKKLKIFGDGVDLPRLKKIAGKAPNIEFLGRVSEEEKAELYSRCIAFINPQEEDFGITVVEAMASGRPVLAYKKGGAVETIIDGQTGILFSSQTAAGIKAAVDRIGEHEFDPRKISEHAGQFSLERFKQEIKRFINDEYIKYGAGPGQPVS
jgi:glycosyltransferase involved in cell wall biosynthesis